MNSATSTGKRHLRAETSDVTGRSPDTQNQVFSSALNKLTRREVTQSDTKRLVTATKKPQNQPQCFGSVSYGHWRPGFRLNESVNGIYNSHQKAGAVDLKEA